MATDVISQYLTRYAEPQAASALAMPGHYDVAAIIPAFDESEAMLDAFQPLMERELKVLMLLVINAPDSLAHSHPAVTRTAALDAHLSSRFPVAWRGTEGLTLYGKEGQSGWLRVDCFSDGRRLASQGGVGLARKIGADITCALFHSGKLAEPWFCSTDADVVPPPDLFAFNRSEHASAQTLALRHCWEGDAQTRVAARLYDFYLHYHVWGLATADSPYAHYAIGSTLVLHARRYAQVRGFPRRAAGEDFHLLAKLAKLAPVYSLASPELAVRARISQRTPFGTGPAISRIRNLPDAVRDYRYINPDCFAALGAVLHAIPALYASDSEPLGKLLQRCLPAHDAQLACALVERAGINGAIRRARRDGTNPQRFERHLHTWFDALKTQQFLHGFRDATQRSVTLDKLLTHPLAPRLPVSLSADHEANLECRRAAMAQCAAAALAKRWRHTKQQ